LKRRTSLLMRCSLHAATIHAATIRRQAAFEHRSISGYLLNVLDHSLWIEFKYSAGLPPPMFSLKSGDSPHAPDRKDRTAIHLRCDSEQADNIRRGARRRAMSISNFVVFSVRRSWRSLEIARAPL